jgi:PAS domain S-box-containing protein
VPLLIGNAGVPPFARADLAWWLVPAGLLAGTVVVYAYAQAAFRLPLLALLLVAALAALGLVAWRLQVYRRALAALHNAVLKAQEGSLEPVALPAGIERRVRPVVADYNLLIKNLGSLFHEMEQCQVWTIRERNRNDAILRGLPGALLTVDGEQRITLSNRQAEELFGRTREELIGVNLFDLLRLDDAGRELLREAFLYGQQIANREIALAFEGGSRHFALNLTFFDGRDDDEPSAALILQDITEHKRLLEITHHTEKLVAMGHLAAGVAHELNTPLGSILGYAQLLGAAMCEPKLAQYAQVIQSEAKRCARIVDNLLAYARRDRCDSESCEIDALIREVVESVNSCQGKRYRVVVEAELDGGRAVVRGGPGQLDIVLVNLMVNAIQAAASVETPRVLVKSCREGNAAVISVMDNGPGVPPELRRRLFDPFFTTKEVGTGSGLGLAISQAIVSRIGGSLHYDPSHRGAHFVLKLPLADGGPAWRL